MCSRWREVYTGWRKSDTDDGLGITFGDQAIFVLADSFREQGGYPQQPIMEDYELVRRLRRCGRMVIVPRPVVTSARRWRANGVVRNTMINIVVTVAYLLRLPTPRIYGFYRRITAATGPDAGPGLRACRRGLSPLTERASEIRRRCRMMFW